MGHGGRIHKRRSQSFTESLSPISFPLNQLRPYSRDRWRRTGKSEVDGKAPEKNSEDLLGLWQASVPDPWCVIQG